MCLDWFRKKPIVTVTVTEVKEIKDIPTTNVIMPANEQTAQDYLNELRGIDTNEPKPTPTEAFYLVQKAGGAWNTVCGVCKGMTYEKLVPKPQGSYQYSYMGWLIKYDIRHDTYTDEQGQKLIVPVIEIKEII